MQNITKFILLISLFVVVVGDWHTGGCPKLKYFADDFDINQYVGKWYGAVRSKAFAFSKGECGIAEYSLNNEGTLLIKNSEILKDGTVSVAEGDAKQTSKSNPFQYGIKFSIFQPVRGDYQILDTDYETYSIIYSCSNFLVARNELVWILSRNRFMDRDLLEVLTDKVERQLGVSRETFMYDDQSEERCKGGL